jgi:putative transposase
MSRATVAAAVLGGGGIQKIKGKPPQRSSVYFDQPLHFVTLCTNSRRQLLANDAVHSAVVEYGWEAARRGIALGRYVILPDHIHLFVAGDVDFDLGIWVRVLKRVVAAAVSGGRGQLWQRGFFDHNSESYSEKWDYVLENPVRAGLVTSPDEWPYQGEIVAIDHS